MPSATPEQIGREAGQAIADAIADGLETILLKLADNIVRVSAEQERQAEEIRALANRIEAVTRLQQTHGAALGALTTDPPPQ